MLELPPVVCHTYCCDADRALCGADISALGPCGIDEDDCDLCTMIHAMELPCKDPQCPLKD